MNQGISDSHAPQPHSNWYRREVERLRERAATITADDQLRKSYLDLANAYERLAEILEGNGMTAFDPPEHLRCAPING